MYEPRDNTAFLAVIHQQMVASQQIRTEIMALTQTPLDLPSEAMKETLTALSSMLATQEKLIKLLVEENENLVDGIENIIAKTS